MNCKNCGQPLLPGDKVCQKCGTPVDVVSTIHVNESMPPIPEVNMVTIPDVKEEPVIPGASVPSSIHVVEKEVTPVIPEVTIPEIKADVLPIPEVTEQVAPVLPTEVVKEPVAPVLPVEEVKPAPSVVDTPLVKKEEIKEKKKGISPLFIIILVAALLAGVFFGYKFIKDREKNPDTDGEVTQKVEYKGYTFNVPTGYVVEKNTDTLKLENNEYGFYLELIEGSYSQIDSSKFVTSFNGEGYETEYVGEKAHDKVNYHLFSLAKENEKVYVAMTSLGTTKLLGVTVYNKDLTSLPSLTKVDEALKIGLTGTYSGETDIKDDSHSGLIANAFIEKEEVSTGDYVGTLEDDYIVEYVDIIVDELN